MSRSFQITGKDTAQIIRGNFFPAREKAQGILLICHGFKGFKDWGFFPHVASTLATRTHVITFNFSHNGVGEIEDQFTQLEKFATNTYSKELADLELLIEQIKGDSLLTDYSLSSLPILLLGHSRGAGVSLIYACDHPQLIKGVIGWNGVTNVDIFAPELKEEMRRSGRAYTENARTKQQMPLDVAILEDLEANKERFDIYTRVQTISIPIILIQGSNDIERLLQGSAHLVQQRPDIQWVKIEGGNHTFQAVHPFAGETEALTEALEHTQQFIDSIL